MDRCLHARPSLKSTLPQPTCIMAKRASKCPLYGRIYPLRETKKDTLQVAAKEALENARKPVPTMLFASDMQVAFQLASQSGQKLFADKPFVDIRW